jgi:hypothetical protein
MKGSLAPPHHLPPTYEKSNQIGEKSQSPCSYSPRSYSPALHTATQSAPRASPLAAFDPRPAARPSGAQL